MCSLRRHISKVPAPVGKEWCFMFSVGVDCSRSEPRCIWLAILKNTGIQPCGAPQSSRMSPLHWQAKTAKGHTDAGPSSNQSPRPVSGEGVACKGPRTLVLQKNSQGFGFTLRHFIVYPPESTLHINLKDEENGNPKGQKARLEPMDTIFVKNVKVKGPAHQAGLCTGDRLVKVNGESVLGKTYSQVIALIQNSENVLELSIMPKDEDVLQLAYSQDAYLRGNEPYTGEAQNLPEPPPICYSNNKPSSNSINHALPENLNSKSIPPAEKCSGGDSSRTLVGQHHLNQHRARSSSSAGITVSPLEFHFANHNAAIASASLPHPRKASLPQASSELCNQALSDWYYSQTERPNPAISHQRRSISQDQLCELQGSYSRCPHSASQDTLLLHYKAAMGSNHPPQTNSYGMGRWGQTSSRSCSENLLAAYASFEQSYGRSLETLEKASVLISPRCEQPPDLANHQPANPAAAQEGRGLSYSQLPTGTQSQRIVQIRHLPEHTVDDQTVGYRSYSPSFCRKASHLLQQSHSFKEPSYTGHPVSWSPAVKLRPLEKPQTSTGTDSLDSRSGTAGMVEEPVQVQIQEVVLRQKPPSGRKTVHVVRNPHYALPLDSNEPISAKTAASRSEESAQQSNGGIAPSPVEQDSLAAIPFIGNLKNSRRSSYLLAITTERSKSCDEGLNSFREEGRVFMRLPKRVKSFFADGSLESLRAAEEARSKRHSTSELGTITLTDIKKDGWLHYKQILTEKGKKVGGGMRPWKRVFCVLRSHSLFLYKDKREAVLHSAGAGSHSNGQGDDEQPISIRGCLIDIAYSETKRKHTLRLTTQDFCEYLLQAEDRDDMLSWIRLIRENSKTDTEELGFSRQALINKKLNDYRKQSPTGNKPDTSPRIHRMMPPFLLSKNENTSGLNRGLGKDESSSPRASWGINIMKKGKKVGPKAFGVRLEDCLPAASDKFVPQIVETCCRLVEEMGLEYIGIYRVPGNNALVSSLQDQLNKGMEINTAEERWQDLNVISSLLKSFFRKLPEPLFTDDKYSDFIEANRLEDAGDRLKTMRKLIHDLPDHYYHTLKFLIGHLKRVADHSDKNKMEPRNLALVFGPTLVRTSEDNMTDMVTHMPDRYKIVETLVLHHTWFFSDELDKDEKTPEDHQDKQPVPNIDHLLSNIGRTMPLGDSSDSASSDSAKCKETSPSKKDSSGKDFLRLSLISAVTRKRKKHQSTCSPGSSTDEDSEHEPIKTSNYEEMRDDRKPEEETEEVSREIEEKPGQVAKDLRCQRRQKEEKGPRAVDQIHSERPRSFLYSQQQSSSRCGPPRQPIESSSSSSVPPQSQNLHGLVTRRKLRERARPHSVYVELSRSGEEQVSGSLSPHSRSLGLSKVKASLLRGQERLRQAVSPGRSSRESRLQPSWEKSCQEQVTPADALWRPASPETRSRRKDWRRHTVLI